METRRENQQVGLIGCCYVQMSRRTPITFIWRSSSSSLLFNVTQHQPSALKNKTIQAIVYGVSILRLPNNKVKTGPFQKSDHKTRIYCYKSLRSSLNTDNDTRSTQTMHYLNSLSALINKNDPYIMVGMIEQKQRRQQLVIRLVGKAFKSQSNDYLAET